jgi:hypothetical protein
MAAQATPVATPVDSIERTVDGTPGGAWKITFLPFLFMLVNFADKIVVGDLGSSSFYLFSASAIIVGFIVNRVPTRCVLLVMGLVWALPQFPMVGTVGRKRRSRRARRCA